MTLLLSLLSFFMGMTVQYLFTRGWKAMALKWEQHSNSWERTANTLLKSTDYWRTRARKLEAEKASTSQNTFSLS